MQPVHSSIVGKFADVYAGPKKGFSAKEITGYFSKYSNYVKPYDHYGIKPKRSELFYESVYALTPRRQYYALNDLAFFEHDSKYDYPSEHCRKGLLAILHSSVSPDPIGLSFSTLRETAFREDWAATLLSVDVEPDVAITNARTMLETVLKTVIQERGVEPDTSGDLMRLLKQSEKVLGVSPRDDQNIHRVLTGLASICQGIASLSNAAGDRHGLAHGIGIDDPSVATLSVNASAVVALALIDFHLLGVCESDGAHKKRIIE
jgi:hypothetical protein